MEKIKTTTSDITVENIEKIIELFPQVATEVENSEGELKRAIDFDVLRDLLGDVAEGQRERYQFTWPGKREAKAEARRPISKTMIPCPEKSVAWNTTENLYIEGDNLDALKLLKETYAGKIKLIYIDPPYNTGKDFIYNDDFVVASDNYEGGEYIEEGCLVANPESNGRFHSDWCSMIYPRLQLARDLLNDEGVIFISIDDNEYMNLQKICDEVFGVENRLETFHIQVRFTQKSLNEKDDFQKVIEQVLIYAKSKRDFTPSKPCEEYSLEKFNTEIIELTSGQKIELGGKLVTIFKPGEYEIKQHNSGRIGLLKATWASGSVLKGNTSGKFFDKYLSSRKDTDGVGCLYKVSDIGDDGIGYRYFTGPKKEKTTKGQFYSGVPLKRIEEIQLGESRKYKPIVNYYDYSGDFGNIRHEGEMNFGAGKKPLKLLENILNIANLKEGDIVMDFFSGSASTADACMHYQEKNNIHIKYIMIQISDLISPDTDLYREGFRSISEVGEERIRRAGKKIADEIEAENQQLKLGEEPKPIPDIGFRVLRIDSSNFKNTYTTPDTIGQDSLLDMIDNVKEGRTAEDILFQVLPVFRIPYSAHIEKQSVKGRTVFDVNHGQLLACFDADVTNDVIEEIARRKPSYAVMRDVSFKDDSAATNFEELFKTFSPDTIRRVI